MTRILVVCLFLAACEPATPASLHIAAAQTLSDDSSRSGTARWKLHARAAGLDCDVLLIESSVPLDARMVEEAHYGAPGLSEDGIQSFARTHRFRGVVYTDRTRLRLWTYGAVTRDEVPSLPVCR